MHRFKWSNAEKNSGVGINGGEIAIYYFFSFVRMFYKFFRTNYLFVQTKKYFLSVGFSTQPKLHVNSLIKKLLKTFLFGVFFDTSLIIRKITNCPIDYLGNFINIKLPYRRYKRKQNLYIINGNGACAINLIY